VIEQVSGALGHPPPAATWTDRAAFAGERDQPVEGAVVAVKPREQPCTIRLLPLSKPSAEFRDFQAYERLVSAAQRLDERAVLIVLLGGDAGLRCGEITALEWSDVDLDKRQLCIQRSEWKGHVTMPKSGRWRYVPMTLHARRSGACDSRARRPSGSRHDATVHAFESRGARRRDSVARSDGHCWKFWSHSGDGHSTVTTTQWNQ
jgi:integrase